MKVTLIRHTSLAIPSGVCYGQTDVDVAASFPQEAAVIKQKLPDNIDAAFSSPLQRCVKLASALALENVNYDARLKELSFGDWEMQAWDDMPREYFDEWAQNYADMPPPSGETFRELQLRGISFINEQLVQYRDQHIVVVTHGGMIRALVAHVLNMQLKGLFRIDVDYGSLTQLAFGDAVPKVNYVNR